MTELEKLELQISVTENRLRSAKDYYHFSTMCGNIAERGEAMLRIRDLEYQLSRLRKQRDDRIGGENNGQTN